MTDEQRSSKELPAKEWRCFHCDEVFVTTVDARLHFGGHQDAESVCRIKQPGEFALLTALRNAEAELERYRREDSDVLRAMWSMQADHTEALRREEEKGFARGVADVKAHPESIGLRLADEPTEAPEIAARLDKADEFIAESRKEPSCSILSTDTEPAAGTLEARFAGLVGMCEKYFGIEPQPFSSIGPETRIHEAMFGRGEPPDGCREFEPYHMPKNGERGIIDMGTHDVKMRVDGLFDSDEEKRDYCDRIAARLRASRAPEPPAELQDDWICMEGHPITAAGLLKIRRMEKRLAQPPPVDRDGERWRFLCSLPTEDWLKLATVPDNEIDAAIDDLMVKRGVPGHNYLRSDYRPSQTKEGSHGATK